MNAPLYIPVTPHHASASPYIIPLGQVHPAGKDYVGMWYTARLKLGIDDRMLYGTFSGGAASPQWYSASHRYYDGIAGIAMMVMTHGAQFPDGLAKGREQSAPSWRTVWKAGRATPLSAPAPKLLWRDLAPELERAPAPLPATLLLSEAETRQVEIAAKAAGVSSTVWLLWTADRAVRAHLCEPGAVLPWVYPVNLRGAVTCERDSMNHCGGFMVTVSDEMDAAAVRQQVSTRLARMEHWRQWWLLNLGRLVGQRGIHLLYRLSRGKPGAFAGSYSNVGDWSVPGIDGITGSAPGSPAYPVCITTMSCNGRRGLAIRVHPVADRDGGKAALILARWRCAVLSLPASA